MKPSVVTIAMVSLAAVGLAVGADEPIAADSRAEPCMEPPTASD
jgi:hypothetical protein